MITDSFDKKPSLVIIAAQLRKLPKRGQVSKQIGLVFPQLRTHLRARAFDVRLIGPLGYVVVARADMDHYCPVLDSLMMR